MKQIRNTKTALALLAILVALGGIILYGRHTPGIKETAPTPHFAPTITGPKTPPPGYVR